jgi:hypothetical protein
MTIKASGRSALILATGLLVCLAGPSHATAAANNAAADATSETTGAPVALDKSAKHGSHHLKKYARRRSGKVALKPSPEAKADAADDGGDQTAIPPSVANANAQLPSVDSPTGDAAKAMTARANDILQTAPDRPADTQVVAADQLNDVDRALHESAPPAPALALASADAPAPPAAPVVTNSGEPSTWDQASLIGKIFIGFGALLTMASAARMFMA